MTRSILVMTVAWLLLGAPATARAGTTWHVDDNAPNDPGPGTPAVSDPLEDGTVARPFDAIQEAIDAASHGDTVLLADGTYTGAGNRDLDYGGRQITVRWASNDPAVCVIDLEEQGRGFEFQSNETEATRLESVTITNGRLEPGAGTGAGLLLFTADPTIVNCIIENCRKIGSGGSAVAMHFASPTFEDCIIRNNTSENPPGFLNRGGAIISSFSSPTFINCEISGNAAVGEGSFEGGAMYISSGSATLIDCEITDNSISIEVTAQGGAIAVSGNLTLVRCTVRNNRIEQGCHTQGGAIHGGAGTIVLEGCVIQGNVAGADGCIEEDFCSGGGINGDVRATNTLFIDNRVHGGGPSPSPTLGGAISGEGALTNCIFIGNTAEDALFGGDGGALWGSFTVVNCTFVGNVASGPGSSASAISSTSTVRNSIFWDHGPDVFASVTLSESNLIEVPPGFVTEPAPGPDGTWGTEDDVGDLRLAAGSPGIDAGDNAIVPPDVLEDFDGRARFHDDLGSPDTGTRDCSRPIVDLGAFEFRGQTPRPADVDGSGVVDIDDLIDAILHWGPCPGCPADVARNAAVDVDDVVAIILDFGCSTVGCAPDCNGNGVADPEDLWRCTSEDCDGNGVPDACQPPVVDCRGTAISAPCAVALDCDGSGVDDACELDGNDCNGNGVLDACDLVSGAGTDCNGNGVLDDCDATPAFQFVAASEPLAPIETGVTHEFVVPSPPGPAADVTVRVEIAADLGEFFEGVELNLNGASLGLLFLGGGSNCPAEPDVVELTLPAPEFLAITFGQDAVFSLFALGGVSGVECPTSFATIELRYLHVDCNGNGTPDSCDIVTATSSDDDGNGIPDECER